MNHCQTCEKETKNPKFCSRSCSAVNSNHKSPKVLKKKRFCKTCGVEIVSRYRNFCESCLKLKRTEKSKERNSLAELKCVRCGKMLSPTEFNKSEGRIKSWCRECCKNANTLRVRLS